jgi:hypothetical protein
MTKCDTGGSRVMMLKSLYVRTVHGIGAVAGAAGVLAWLERRQDSRTARWARSLFAIHDIDAMVALDLPWWTFDAIDEVDAFLATRPHARVLEYGSGASTVWLARRADSVTSIEHDIGWHPVVAAQVASMPGVDLRLVPPDAPADTGPGYRSFKPGWQNSSFRHYVEAIDQLPGLFDLIVIDGRARAACLDHAESRLAPDGMIVFDNSNRSRYRAAIAGSKLKRVETSGLTACLPYPDATTLLVA